MIFSIDYVGGVRSNLSEWMGLPPPSQSPESSWYVVQQQQPACGRKQNGIFQWRTEKPLLNYWCIQLSTAVNSHNETCSGTDQALICCHSVILAPVSSGSGQMQGYGPPPSVQQSVGLQEHLTEWGTSDRSAQGQGRDCPCTHFRSHCEGLCQPCCGRGSSTSLQWPL